MKAALDSAVLALEFSSDGPYHAETQAVRDLIAAAERVVEDASQGLWPVNALSDLHRALNG